MSKSLPSTTVPTFFWWSLALGALVVCGYSTLSTIAMYSEYSATDAKRAEVARRLDEQQERSKYLEERLRYVATPRGEEELIRERYELSRPHETEFIIVRKPEEGEGAARAASPTFWTLIERYFK